jgi:hypothetical protein
MLGEVLETVRGGVSLYTMVILINLTGGNVVLSGHVSFEDEFPAPTTPFQGTAPREGSYIGFA